MKLKDVIEKLEKFRDEHGDDIEVRIATGHDYWGTLYNTLHTNDLEYNSKTTINPKKYEETPAIVISAE